MSADMNSYHNSIHALLTILVAILLYFYLETREKLQDLDTSNPASNGNRSENVKRGNNINSLLLEGSSVWCVGSNHSRRRCHFKNLCYSPHQDRFVFFHSKYSIIDGATYDGPALVDMSSVADHNMQYFNYDDLPVAAASRFNATLISGRSLILNRFHPGNLMHIFHDDLLPVYHTLNTMTHFNMADAGDIRLVFMEGREAGEFQDLYNRITDHNPLFKEDFHKSSAEDSLVCFQMATVGVSKHTTWYEYGFKQPQGPLPHIKVNALEIRQFAAFIKQRLGIADIQSESDELKNDDINKAYQPKFVVIFSRKQNRLILNELDLSLNLSKEFNLQVMTLSLETHTLVEMIEIISQAKIAIGFHGSLLILSLFLPPLSVLVELFPYAVNPDHYTPYKTLVSLPGMGITYLAWRNDDIMNSVPHPEYPPELGGLGELSTEKREEILSSSEVVPHLCCSDPEWLFRIYQDTVVDVSQVTQLVHYALKTQGSLEEYKSKMDILENHNIIPAQVNKLTCLPFEDSTNGKAGLWVSWQQPWNIEFLDNVDIWYEVWIQEKGREDFDAYKMKKTSHKFLDGLKPNTEYYIWARCILEENRVGLLNSDVVLCQTTGD